MRIWIHGENRVYEFGTTRLHPDESAHRHTPVAWVISQPGAVFTRPMLPSGDDRFYK